MSEILAFIGLTLAIIFNAATCLFVIVMMVLFWDVLKWAAWTIKEAFR